MLEKILPKYIEKLIKLEKQKGIPFKNISELRKIIKAIDEKKIKELSPLWKKWSQKYA